MKSEATTINSGYKGDVTGDIRTSNKELTGDIRTPWKMTTGDIRVDAKPAKPTGSGRAMGTPQEYTSTAGCMEDCDGTGSEE